jgi:hypothetical protein
MNDVNSPDKGFGKNGKRKVTKRFVWMGKDFYICTPLQTKGNVKFIER